MLESKIKWVPRKKQLPMDELGHYLVIVKEKWEGDDYNATFNYYDKHGNSELIDGSVGIFLNDTVEILEEENKIKPIKTDSKGNIIDVVDGETHYISTNRKDKNVYIPILNYLIDEINKLKEDK